MSRSAQQPLAPWMAGRALRPAGPGSALLAMGSPIRGSRGVAGLALYLVMPSRSGWEVPWHLLGPRQAWGRGGGAEPTFLCPEVPGRPV